MLGKINIIFGCTSSGKTSYGVDLAKKLNGEVINADSMQIYHELPIITGQPTGQEKQGVQHHLYGYKSVFEPYSVAKFINDVVPVIDLIRGSGKTPILVGGTGMYLKSLVEGMAMFPEITKEVDNEVQALVDILTSAQLHSCLKNLDPISAAKIDPSNLPKITRAFKVFLQCGQSIEVWRSGGNKSHFAREDFHIIWLNPGRELVYNKINQRLLQFIENGAIDEIAKLLRVSNNFNYPKAHGLPEIIRYLRGDITSNEMVAKSQQITRNYAKRQLTWARHQFKFDQVITEGF